MAETALQNVLFVLKAKTDDFKSAMGDAAKTTEEASKRMEASTEGVGEKALETSERMEKFRNQVLAIAGAGGLAELVKSSFEAAEQLGTLSEQTGLSTKFLQEMRYAASQLNVNQDTLNQSLQIFTRKIGDAAIGGEEARKAFDVLRVSVTDTNGQTKNAEQLFNEVADKLSNVKSETERAAIAQEMFGRSGIQMVNILAQGSGGLRELAAKANELGVVLDARLIESAKETNDKMQALAMILKAQVSKAVIELAPGIQTLTEKLIGMAKWTNDAAMGWGAIFRNLLGGKKTNDDILLGLTMQLDALKKYGGSAADIKKVEQAIMDVAGADQKAVEAKKHSTEATESLIIAEKKRMELQKSAQGIVDKTQEGDKGEQLQKEIETLEKAQEQKIKIKGDYNEAIAQLEQDQEDFYQSQDDEEIDKLSEKLSTMRALKDSAYADEIESGELRLRELMSQEDKLSTSVLKAKQKDMESQKKLSQERMRDAESSLNWISQLQYSKSKEMAAVGKAAAIVSTTISTYEAAQKAFSSMAGIPIVGPVLGAVAAAAAVAAGLSRVASISGMDIGFATGVDSVPGVGFGDSVPAMLQPGERVVKTDTNRVLEQFLKDYRDNGSSGNGTIRVEFALTENFMDLIETRLVERGRANISIQGS
jgi:hypothetical protein